MCCSHVCVPTKRAECLLRASAPQEPFQPQTSTREERAKGSCCSLWAGLQYNKLPSLFSPVETSDHAISFYVSDGIFSHVALCCNGTSTRENTHGKLYEDSGQSQLRLGGLVTSSSQTCWKMFQKFPVFTHVLHFLQGLIIYILNFDQVEMWYCSKCLQSFYFLNYVVHLGNLHLLNYSNIVK